MKFKWRGKMLFEGGSRGRKRSTRSCWVHSDNNDIERAVRRTDIWKVFLRVVNRVSSSVICFRSEAQSEAMRHVKWKARMKSPESRAEIHDRDEIQRVLRSIRTFPFAEFHGYPESVQSDGTISYILLAFFFPPRVAFRPSFMFEPPIFAVRLRGTFSQVFIFDRS